METRAAILDETGAPLVQASLETPGLRPGQVLVEIAFSGLCHTQLLEARGHRGPDAWLPHCLGHEGSGRVLEAGPGITRVVPGQSVVLSWIQGPGIDAGGSQYDWDGKKVNAGPVTTFQHHAVVSENRLTPLDGDFPLRTAALLGCAVPTGFGAVFNTARVRAGDSVAILGTGGVGLCAVAAAATAGAARVIAVDIEPAKLELSRNLGATDAFLPGDPSLPKDLDVVIEATGRPEVMAKAMEMLRPRGGRAVVIGNAHHGEVLSLDPRQFNQGKSLLGTWGGDSDPARDYPRYVDLLRTRVDLSGLQNAVYPLEEANLALDDLEAGRAIRPLLDMGGTGR